ncbi:hypothetical protein DFH09DRAFT_1413366 [Mycena vulgaris]|nr:hypothetical protein DFH09DRAFT_1413366 [Mycena vulgaris]
MTAECSFWLNGAHSGLQAAVASAPLSDLLVIFCKSERTPSSPMDVQTIPQAAKCPNTSPITWQASTVFVSDLPLKSFTLQSLSRCARTMAGTENLAESAVTRRSMTRGDWMDRIYRVHIELSLVAWHVLSLLPAATRSYDMTRCRNLEATLSSLLPPPEVTNNLASRIKRRRLQNVCQTLVAGTVFGVQELVGPPLNYSHARGMEISYRLRGVEHSDSIDVIFRTDLLGPSDGVPQQHFAQRRDAFRVSRTHRNLASEAKDESQDEAGDRGGSRTEAGEEDVVAIWCHVEILNLAEDKKIASARHTSVSIGVLSMKSAVNSLPQTVPDVWTSLGNFFRVNWAFVSSSPIQHRLCNASADLGKDLGRSRSSDDRESGIVEEHD